MVEIILLHRALGAMLSDTCQGLCTVFMFHLLEFALWPSCAVTLLGWMLPLIGPVKAQGCGMWLW